MTDRYQQQAQFFRFLSHPVRLHILDELRRDAACVCHLEVVLGRPQPYVSQQLRVLREAGVIVDSKEGLNVYYRLADPTMERLLEDILGPAGEPAPVAGCPCPKCTGDKDGGGC